MVTEWFVYGVLLLLFNILAIFAHIIILYEMQKAKLNNNRCTLIKLLSISDALYSISASSYLVSVATQTADSILGEGFRCMSTVFNSFSLAVTVTLSVDRCIAAKFSLTYNSIVTKRRITFAMTFVLFAIAISLGFLSKTVGKSDNIFNKGPQTFITCIRIICIISLIVIGIITTRVQKEHEKLLKTIKLPLGEKTENLIIFGQLKRSVRDIQRLSFWSIVFLLPFIVTHTWLRLNYVQKVRKAEICLQCLYVCSNPLIYVATQTKLRNLFKNVFGIRPAVTPERR